MMNDNGLSVSLKNDSLQVKADKATRQSLVLMVENTNDQAVACSSIQVEIPFGAAGDVDALTDSDDFMATGVESWVIESPPYDLNAKGDQLQIELFNDYEVVGGRQQFNFTFYNIPVHPNSSGTSNRSLAIKVSFFKASEDTPFRTVELPLQLVVPSGPPLSYVNYFVSDVTAASPRQQIKLSWSVSNPRQMFLYPTFLSDRDQAVDQTEKSTLTGLRSIKSLDEVRVIFDDTPIPLSEADASMQVVLLRSMQFRLVADNEGNRGVSELTIYLKELSILYFTRNFSDRQLLRPGGSILLKWLISFPYPASTDNEATLIVQEFDNKGQILPLQEGHQPAPAGLPATWTVDLPEAHKGTFVVFPNRPTNYLLYIKDYKSSNSKIETQSIMITPPNSPIGSIMLYAGASQPLPYGWLLCNGKEVKKSAFIDKWQTAYQKQFGKVPADYGQYLKQSFDQLYATLDGKDGVVKLPDLQDRFPVGAGKNYTLGAEGGAEKVTLKVDQMPKHKHEGIIAAAGEHSHSFNASDKGWAFNNIGRRGDPRKNDKGTVRTSKEGRHTHAMKIHEMGGDESHENRPPYLATYFIIKVLK